MKKLLFGLALSAMASTVASAKVYESVSPAEGVITKSLKQITVEFPNTETSLPNESMSFPVRDAMGNELVANVIPGYNSWDEPQLKLDKMIMESGDYYFEVQEGAFLLDAGTENERLSPAFPLHYCVTYGRNALPYTSASVPEGFCQSLSELTLTFNYTDQLTVIDTQSIGLYSDGEIVVAATSAIAEGNALKISFGQVPDGKYTFNMAEGAVSCHDIPSLEVSYDYEISGNPYDITPADGSTVGSLSQIAIEFKQNSDVSSNYRYNGAPAKVYDAAGNEVAHDIFTDYKGNVGLLNLSKVINAPGTYTVEVPAELFSLDFDWDTYQPKAYSPEFKFTYTVTGEEFTPVQTIPAEGEVVGSMFGVDLIFDTQEVVNVNAPSSAYIVYPNGTTQTVASYSVEADYENPGHVHVSYYNPLIESGEYHLIFPMGYFEIDDQPSTVLDLTFTLVEGEPVLPTEVSPASESEVAFIQDITLTFGNADEVTYTSKYGNTIYVFDAEGNRVPGTYVDFYTSGLATFTGNQVKLHFSNPVTDAGQYNITIAKGTFMVDQDVNSTFTLSYTVKEQQVDLVEFSPVNAVEKLSTIEVVFTNTDQLKLNNAVADEVEAVLYNAATSDKVTVVRKVDINGTTATLTLKKAVTEVGQYELVIPEKFFRVGEDEHLSVELRANFEVKAPYGPEPGTYDVFEGEVEVALPNASGRYSYSSVSDDYAYYSVAFYNVPLDEDGFIEGAGELLNVEFVVPYSEHMDIDQLAGTYTPSQYQTGDIVPGTFIPGMWSDMMGYWVAAGTALMGHDEQGYTNRYGIITDGTIAVTKLEDGNFQVVFDLTTKENAHITASYTGDLAHAIQDFTGGTAIEEVESATSDSTQDIYNLNGQLTQSKKGLVIANGKVVLMK